jgi:hypothetical protein
MLAMLVKKCRLCSKCYRVHKNESLLDEERKLLSGRKKQDLVSPVQPIEVSE